MLWYIQVLVQTHGLNMNEKYFEQLSSAYLAHFCRRLSDLIIEQGSEILREMKLVTPATAMSTVFFLKKNDKVTVAMLADALGVSHQMATQRINALEKIGIVKRVSSDEDKRAKAVILTKHGKSEVRKLEPFAKQMTDVLEEFEAELGSQLTKLIRQAELALLDKPLKLRLNQKR